MTTAILPYFGGKRTMAPRIAELLGKHVQYFEPFCGSMATLFAKEKSRQETVNDLHGDLINLALVIQQRGAELFRRLRRTPLHDDLVGLAHEQLTLHFICSDRGDVDRAYWYFIVSWMGVNGLAGLRHKKPGRVACVRYTPNGGDPATRFRNTVDSIPAFQRRLRDVTIIRRDAFEWLPKVPDIEGVAIYADPPYIEKSDEYLHDFDLVDHERLRDALARFTRARVVISYYDCEQVRSLYDGWKFIECARQKHLASTGGKGKTKAPEVLIINSRAPRSLF